MRPRTNLNGGDLVQSTSLFIQGFSEGLDIVAVAMQGDFFGNSMSYMGNGYELLRQLVKEFSLRSRSESSKSPGFSNVEGVSS